MLLTLRIALAPFAEIHDKAIGKYGGIFVMFVSKAHPAYTPLTKNDKMLLDSPMINNSAANAFLGKLLEFFSPDATTVLTDSTKAKWYGDCQISVYKRTKRNGRSSFSIHSHIAGSVILEKDLPSAIPYYKQIDKEWTVVIKAAMSSEYSVRTVIKRSPTNQYMRTLLQKCWLNREILFKYVSEIGSLLWNAGTNIINMDIFKYNKSQKMFNKWLILRGNVVKRLFSAEGQAIPMNEKPAFERMLIRDCLPLDINHDS